MPEFARIQDWHDYINQCRQENKSLDGVTLFNLRKECYSKIEKHLNRSLIIYATKIVAVNVPNYIDIGDVDGFTDLVNSISKEKKEIAVMIHSPGGFPDATERIVNILRNRFNDVIFLIPHSAYSAATMLAMSGNKIIFHPSAAIGPIDPQIGGIPARTFKRGFEKIKQKIVEEGPKSLPVYIPLLEKYSIELLELCDDAEKLSKELVSNWLELYMFSTSKDKKNNERIKKIVDYISDYDTHLIHSRSLSIEKLAELGLKIEVADEDLRKYLWEAYILINGFFEITAFVKLYESSTGISWGRQFVQPAVQQNVIQSENR